MKSEAAIKQLYDDLKEAQDHAETPEHFSQLIGEIAVLEYVMEYPSPRFEALHKSYSTIRQTVLSSKAHRN